MLSFGSHDIVPDIWNAYENIQDQVGAPLANQDDLTTDMQRIIKLIDRCTWNSERPTALVEQLTKHANSAANART